MIEVLMVVFICVVMLTMDTMTENTDYSSCVSEISPCMKALFLKALV